MPNVQYKISIPSPHKHHFHIEIEVSPADESIITISLPNWIPGSYMIRDFSKHVLELKAFDGTSDLTIQTVSKNRFSIAHNNRSFKITYLYYAFDLSVRKAYLDQEFGFINPASALFCIDQLANEICEIELLQPTNQLCRNWKPATGLDGINHNHCFAWNRYKADNYIELTDYPILFGDLKIAEFSVAGVPHYLVTAGQHFGDLERAAADLSPICQYHIDTFGELPADVKKYLFLTMVTDNGFGGLEHLNSTALVCSRFDIAAQNESRPITNDNYITFLSLCSHEYLHTWNVKRLKPREFIPYQLEHEVYTKQLWFYEGMTSYLDDLSLVHTNTISTDKYLEIFAKTLTRIERGKGQLRQSVTESSMHTWTKFYQQDEAAPDQITSYYQKGAAIACMADLLIKQETNNELGLRDLMRKAWLLYGKEEIGTRQIDLEQLFKSFLTESSYSFIEQGLYQTDKISLSESFSHFGVSLKYNHQDNQKHLQGSNAGDTELWLGAILTSENNSLVVKQVLEDSPAESAGIAKGDVVIAINNLKVTPTNLEQLIGLNTIEQTKVHYFRKDTLYVNTLEKAPSPMFVANLSITDKDLADIWLKIDSDS